MTDTTTAPTRDDLAAEVDMLQLQLEDLTEATADASRLLALDDAGWVGIGDDGVISAEQVGKARAKARVMAIADPLIRRGINLRVAYVWGTGLAISADTGATDDTNTQDVNSVVQTFLDDPSNAATFTTGQAHERLERALAVEGEKFLALATTPATGRVEVRHIPVTQVVDIVTNPEDAEEAWFYKRTWTANEVLSAATGAKTRPVTKTVYYPALGFRPNRRPRTWDGHPIEWDTPVLHIAVNRPEGSLRGTPDVLAALPWAEGYKDFLTDWARLVKALSRFAFQATVKGRRGAAAARERITAGPAGDGQIGQTAIVGEGQKLEAIGKTGATIDSRSGFPMAAMTAAALDIPATMLTADPGVTGARATAETLDRPLELVIMMRRDLWASAFRAVLTYVVDCAVRAGRLRGTRTVDPYTGRLITALAGGQRPGINIDFPDLSEIDLKTLMEAIEVADNLGKIPPLTIVRIALSALRVDNLDEVLEKVTDPETGEFIDPNLAADTAAAQAAIRAFRNGTDPAGTLR